MYRRNPVTGRFLPTLEDPAELFFFRHAGFSYGPGETPLAGRVRCAKQLAAAERTAKERDVTFEWEQDDITNREHTDEGPEYYLWACVARDATGAVFASLGGVDFGHNDGNPREPWGSDYARVVEAELACELPAEDIEPSNN